MLIVKFLSASPYIWTLVVVQKALRLSYFAPSYRTSEVKVSDTDITNRCSLVIGSVFMQWQVLGYVEKRWGRGHIFALPLK